MGTMLSERSLLYDFNGERIEIMRGDAIYFNDIIIYNQCRKFLNNHERLKPTVNGALIFYIDGSNKSPSIIVDSRDVMETIALTKDISPEIKKTLLEIIGS